MLQCFVLCHIIDQVIVMLVTACVCCLFFYVGASFVNLGMALDSIAFYFGVFTSVICGRVCDFISTC